MAGAQVAISALPLSATVVTTDVLGLVIGGTTKKITSGNFRAQLFSYAATDPLNCGILTAVGNSTITGTLSGITTLSCTALTATTLTGALSGAQTGITQIGTLAADLLFTDATYDIGKASVTRPRDIFASRNLTVGGFTTSGGISITGSVTAATGSSIDLQLITTTGYLTSYDHSGLAFQTLVLRGSPITLSSGAAGGLGWNVDSTGHFRAITDNSYDIGAAGALRPRNLFVAGNGTFGGSLFFGAASAKITPGATNFGITDTAGANNNILIADSGLVTFRNNITFAASPQIQMPAAGNVDFRLASNAGSALLIQDTGTVQVSNGVLTTRASVTGGAGLRLAHGVAPTSPVNGDMWTTTAGAFIQINGVTKTFTLT